jgi:predicted RNase H-like HicB family nuclease
VRSGAGPQAAKRDSAPRFGHVSNSIPRRPYLATLVKCWVMKYRVYLEPDEDGVFVATCPALPGCVSQGRTRIEATENIREAIEGYLKSLRKHGDPLPPSILEEVIEVAGG